MFTWIFFCSVETTTFRGKDRCGKSSKFRQLFSNLSRKMAEHVFQNLEAMLPELEDLERNGIFERNELRIIIKKRTDLEYKLQRRIVKKKDFLKYLEYELNVDSLRRKRMQRLGLKMRHTAAEIGIKKRMHYVFQRALKKFGNDLTLWMQYIDFCKKTDSKAATGKALGKLMQIHAKNPSVWIMAAKWEFEDKGNIDNARALMQRALRLIPESKTLWLEYFRLELLHVDKIKKRKEILSLSTEGDQLESGDIPHEFLANKTASVVYRNAIKAFPDDVDFRVEFLAIYRLFPETKGNENEVYEGLKQDFEDNEAANSTLARRPLDALLAEVTSGTTAATDKDWKDAEGSCQQLFEECVKKFNTGSIYEEYLKTFLELIKQKDATTAQTTRRIRTILEILNNADKNGLITEQMFLAWSELLVNLDDAEGVVETLSKAVDCLYTPALCERYLSVITQISDDWDFVDGEFKKCIQKIDPKDSLALWQLWMNVCVKRESADAMKVFEMSLAASEEVAEVGRSRYLQWTFETKGIKEFRRLFKRLKEACSLSQSVIQQALTCESQQDKKSLSRIRNLYELAIDNFGKNSIDCWLELIKFELEQKETAVDLVGRIYWRALNTLDSNLVGGFIDKYTLLKTN